MFRMGQMSWLASARLIAFLCWGLALALTGGMGWQAWTSMQEIAGPSRYGITQIDPVITATRQPGDAAIIASKNLVAR